MTVLNIRKIARPILLVVAVVLLAAMVLDGCNYLLNRSAAKADRSNAMQVMKPLAENQISPVMVPDFFVEYRLERDRLRSEQADVLQEMIRTATSDDVRLKAQDAVLKLVVEKQREEEMENLIKANGFADALVIQSENDVSAVIKTQSLKREDVLQVADIISRIAGVKPEDITISAKQ